MGTRVRRTPVVPKKVAAAASKKKSAKVAKKKVTRPKKVSVKASKAKSKVTKTVVKKVGKKKSAAKSKVTASARKKKAFKAGPCNEQEEYNEKTGNCVKKCPDGKQRNAKGNCVNIPGKKSLKAGPCNEKQVYNEKTGNCVKKCPDGKQRNAKGNCVNIVKRVGKTKSAKKTKPSGRKSANAGAPKRPLTPWVFFVMDTKVKPRADMKMLEQKKVMWDKLTSSEKDAYAKKALSWNIRNGRVKITGKGRMVD